MPRLASLAALFQPYALQYCPSPPHSPCSHYYWKLGLSYQISPELQCMSAGLGLLWQDGCRCRFLANTDEGIQFTYLPHRSQLTADPQSQYLHQKKSTTSITAMARPVKVAAVQAEPGWNDLQASVDKTITLIEDAGKKGANVLGFPEVFIPGYPWSIWHHSPLGKNPVGTPTFFV